MSRLLSVAIGTIILAGIQSVPPAARAGQAEILVEECHKQLNLGESGCACIGERADRILNDKQRQLVVAMVTRDQAASSDLRAHMSDDETSGAENFMNEAPRVCATQ